MKVNVLTPRFGGPFINGRDLVSTLNKKGIVANHIHKLKNLLTSPLYQSADVVHAMGIPITYRVWRKPVVLTILGDHRMEKSIWRFLFPKAIEKADFLTTTSQFLKEVLDLHDVIVIPNAILPERYNLAEHTDKDTVKLVMVTSFYFPKKAKGVLNLAEIVAKAQRTTEKNIQCTVVGGGPYLEEIKSKVRKNVKIDFVGFRLDPRKNLEKSDIFVYYSGHDNFPTAILEAMACGLPMVTNEVGAVPEIVTNEKDGYVARNDDDYLIRLLNLLESYKLRQKIGQNARKTVERKFNWKNIVDKFIEIYEFSISYQKT